MNDRQMRYFIAVAEELSFSRAARRLNISQPPLSMQIKELECDLGATLLARTRRTVELTAAGRLFLDHARKAIRQMDRAGEIVRQSSNGEAGLLRMGFTSSVPMLAIFARMMHRFRTTFPDVRIDLHHMSTHDQFKALDSDQLDVGILRPPGSFHSHPHVDVYEIWRDRLMVFLPSGHPLARGAGPITMEQLAGEDFVTVSQPIGCGVFDQMTRLCAASGFSPKIAQESKELFSVLGLVAAGLGVSILPECYAQVSLPGVVVHPLANAEIESRLLLAVARQVASRVPARFVEIAQDCLREERVNKAA